MDTRAMRGAMMAGFCGGCGSPRPDGAKFCMNCGQPFAAAQALCPTCGQALDEPSVTPATPAAPAPPPPPTPAPPPVPATAPAPTPVSPAVANTSPGSAPLADEPAEHHADEGSTLPRGPYASDLGTVFFDGAGWYEARLLAGGVWIPDVTKPLADMDPDSMPVTPLGPSETGGPDSGDLGTTTRG